MPQVTVDAEPESIAIDVDLTALVIIDMQRDFLEPGGFGETLGNDVSLLGAAVGPCKAVLETARRRGMVIIHTREGHRPDMSDAPKAKVERGDPRTVSYTHLPVASWSIFVFPMTMAPASTSRWTTGEVSVATRASAGHATVVGRPATSMLSLTEKGSP